MKKAITIFLIIFTLNITLFSLNFKDHLKSYNWKEVQVYTLNQNGTQSIFYFGTIVEVHDDFIILNNKQANSFISIKIDVIGIIAITEKNLNKK